MPPLVHANVKVLCLPLNKKYLLEDNKFDMNIRAEYSKKRIGALRDFTISVDARLVKKAPERRSRVQAN